MCTKRARAKNVLSIKLVDIDYHRLLMHRGFLSVPSKSITSFLNTAFITLVFSCRCYRKERVPYVGWKIMFVASTLWFIIRFLIIASFVYAISNCYLIVPFAFFKLTIVSNKFLVPMFFKPYFVSDRFS